MKKLLTLAIPALLAMTTSGWACDEYKTMSQDELKQYRDVLSDANADPIDRFFAYQGLACSDQPVMRAYATRAGLASARDPILRQQIAFDALMALPRIDLELAPNGANEKVQRFLKENGTVFSYEVRYRSRQQGCIEFYSRNACQEGRSLTLKGETMLFNVGDLVGTLTLTDAGEYIGAVRFKGNPIPARIRVY